MGVRKMEIKNKDKKYLNDLLVGIERNLGNNIQPFVDKVLVLKTEGYNINEYLKKYSSAVAKYNNVEKTIVMEGDIISGYKI